MGKIEIDNVKMLESILGFEAEVKAEDLRNNPTSVAIKFIRDAIKKALEDQGLEYKDGKLNQIESKPEVKSFAELLTDDLRVKIPIHHPKTYCHLLKDALPLTKEGQYIVIERVQVETLEEFRNKVASLEESKPFLPLIDNEIERLLALEQLHLSHIVGFLVPKETRFVEKH